MLGTTTDSRLPLQTMKLLSITALVPFLLALAWLGLAVFDAAPIIPDVVLWSVVAAAFVLPILALIGARLSPRGARVLRVVAFVTPCFVARRRSLSG